MAAALPGPAVGRAGAERHRARCRGRAGPRGHPDHHAPHPWCFDGLDAIRPLLSQGLTEPGEWRLVPTRANRQPTAASYLRAPDDTEFRAFKFDVVRIEGGRIAEITTFDATLFPAFGLPPTL